MSAPSSEVGKREAVTVTVVHQNATAICAECGAIYVRWSERDGVRRDAPQPHAPWCTARDR